MEAKTQLSITMAGDVRQMAWSRNMSVSQYIRAALELKMQADRDGLDFSGGRWVKQAALRMEDDRVVRE